MSILSFEFIFFLALVPEARAARDRKSRGGEIDFATGMDATPMGRGIKRIAGWFGLMQDEP